MDNQFSLILKSLRITKGYTQEELSNLLGIGQTTIANYENSIRFPDMAKLMEIADLFNVSLDFLTGRDSTKLEDSINYNKKDIIGQDSIFTYDDYLHSLINGDKENCLKLSFNILGQDMDIIKFYEEIIHKSLVDIGLLWERGEIDIWKEHFISEISLDIMKILYPHFISNKININKTIIGLTPGAEIHNIGLRMVCDVFHTKGWNSIYLGSNIPTLSVLDAISANKARAILLSVTLPIHIEAAKNLIYAIRKVYKEDVLSIIVGGSAFKDIKDVKKTLNADYYFETLNDIDHYLELL